MADERAWCVVFHKWCFRCCYNLRMSEIFYPHRGVNASKEQAKRCWICYAELAFGAVCSGVFGIKNSIGRGPKQWKSLGGQKKKGRRKQEHLRVAGVLAFSAPLVSETPPRPRHKKKNFKGKHDDQNSATLSLKRAEIVCYFFLWQGRGDLGKCKWLW